MCEFFSFLSDGKGSYIYADDKTRKDNPGIQHDSYTWLSQHFLGKKSYKLEDLYNKYEYNPLTKELRLYNRGQKCEDDFDSTEKWCNELNFKRIIPELNIKKIKNPLVGKPKTPTKNDISNLMKWIEISNKYIVYDSVCNSVWKSVCNSFMDIVCNSVCNRAGDNVWKIVRNSVRNNVGDNVWNSVCNNVWNSVGNTVYNYIASLINIEYDFDIKPGNKLWNKGFVPSFDGKIWRLHSGKDATIVYTYTP